MLFKRADQVLEGEGAGRKLTHNNNVIPIKCGGYTMPQFSAQKEEKKKKHTQYLTSLEFKYKWQNITAS